jgi:hypothetical protein
LTLDLVEAAGFRGVESDMRSIGETARASGLSVSALRFYDRAGVLVPALVDPENGYRWYSEPQVDQARLVAGLRRVGMPVAASSRCSAPTGRPRTNCWTGTCAASKTAWPMPAVSSPAFTPFSTRRRTR